VPQCSVIRMSAVQKLSNLWPGNKHLHAWRSATLVPFDVVSLWLNTLLPAVLLLFKAFLECLFANGVELGHCVPYNVVSWLKSSPFQLCFQVGEQPIIARSPVVREGACRATGILCLVKKVRITCEEWAGASAQISQTPSTRPNHLSKWNVPNSAYPHLLRKFSDMTWWSCLTKVCTWLMSSSFQLVEGVPERALLPTDVCPWLNWLYHSLICVMPMVSSPKTRWIFQMASTWLLPSFWQNLMQYCCSSCSVIFTENNNVMNTAYTLSLTRWLYVTDAVCWWGKIHVCAWRYPPPPHHSTPPVLH